MAKNRKAVPQTVSFSEVLTYLQQLFQDESPIAEVAYLLFVTGTGYSAQGGKLYGPDGEIVASEKEAQTYSYQAFLDYFNKNYKEVRVWTSPKYHVPFGPVAFDTLNLCKPFSNTPLQQITVNCLRAARDYVQKQFESPLPRNTEPNLSPKAREIIKKLWDELDAKNKSPEWKNTPPYDPIAEDNRSEKEAKEFIAHANKFLSELNPSVNI